MPWYKAGTVSAVLNSTTVTGSGTQFAANCRVGDAFRGPDGRWYEIVNVPSDTVLSISPAYQGPTASGGSYALAPMQGYVKESADALRALVNQFGSVLAVLGTTGTQAGIRASLGLGAAATESIIPLAKGGTGRSDGKAIFNSLGVASPYGPEVSTQGMYMSWNGEAVPNGAGNFVCNRGTGAGGFTWRSVNGNNTATGPTMTYSYDGLLTVQAIAVSSPIQVGSGGTGGNTQATARSGLGLGSAAVADIVGLVASGAIIETATNTNGTYIKFADGTQICRRKERTVKTLNQVSGALFWGGAEGEKAFPAAFIAAPTINITATLETGEAWFAGAASLLLSTTSWPNGIVFTQVSRPIQQVAVDYLAIGRWK